MSTFISREIRLGKICRVNLHATPLTLSLKHDGREIDRRFFIRKQKRSPIIFRSRINFLFGLRIPTLIFEIGSISSTCKTECCHIRSEDIQARIIN